MISNSDAQIGTNTMTTSTHWMSTTPESKLSTSSVPSVSTDLSCSVELPDDVFEAGEVKPTRPLKKKATNGNNKRAAPDVGYWRTSKKRSRRHTPIIPHWRSWLHLGFQYLERRPTSKATTNVNSSCLKDVRSSLVIMCRVLWGLTKV